MAIESEEEEEEEEEEEKDTPHIIHIVSSSVNSENNMTTEKPPNVEGVGMSGKQQIPGEVVTPAAKPTGGPRNKKKKPECDRWSKNEKPHNVMALL